MKQMSSGMGKKVCMYVYVCLSIYVAMYISAMYLCNSLCSSTNPYPPQSTNLFIHIHTQVVEVVQMSAGESIDISHLKREPFLWVAWA